jgi:aspartate--ammonia ligase
LNGVERPVAFPIKDMQEERAEVVHSLAKWKRQRLTDLEFPVGKGLWTDMRALRPDEELSPIHSISVDQWDWEKVIAKSDRKLAYLRKTVRQIYEAIKSMEQLVFEHYPQLLPQLADQIYFISAKDLQEMYPECSPKEREDLIVRQHKAVFIMGIGGKLGDAAMHDGRAPDYDDWSTLNEQGFAGLNGDLLVWHPVLEKAFELSSMGIRVDAEALQRQLALRGVESWAEKPFHQALLSGQLAQTIGGGIGQSRLCMFLLRKAHIGEVQQSIWPEGLRQSLAKQGIELM